MYSNGLKQFRVFIESTFEDCKQETSIKELESKFLKIQNMKLQKRKLSLQLV